MSASRSLISAQEDALNQQFTGAPVKVAIDTSSTRSTLLPAGRYRITTNAECWYLQGGSAVTLAAIANGHYLGKAAIDYLTVTSAADGYVAVIASVAGGNFELSAQ